MPMQDLTIRSIKIPETDMKPALHLITEAPEKQGYIVAWPEMDVFRLQALAKKQKQTEEEGEKK